MESRLVMLNNIKPNLEKVNIRVRVRRSWIQNSYVNNRFEKSLEMILLDEDRNMIQAAVRQKLTRQFEQKLSIGTICEIGDFKVATNDSRYKVFNHSYKINFWYKTTVTNIDDFRGHLYGFRFTSLKDIKNKLIKENENVDELILVIGKLIGIGGIKHFESNGKPNKRLSFELQDIEGNKLPCTVFGEFAEELFNYVEVEENGEPIVVIIHLGKTSFYRDLFNVTNNFYGTKLFIDYNLEEIKDFKKSMSESGFPYDKLVRFVSVPSQSGVLGISSPDDFIGETKRMPLDEITEHKKVDTYLSYATIDNIDCKDEWAYIACKKCTRKVKQLNGDEFVDGTIDEQLASAWKCNACGPWPREFTSGSYKVQIRVVDDTGSASFTIFEKDVFHLIKKTAYDLKKNQHEDDDSLPDDLRQIVGKKLLFKVCVTDYNISKNRQVYTVSKLTDDADIINMFKKSHGIDEDMPSYDNISFGNDTSSQGKPSSKEACFVTGDNGSTIDLTTSTAESPTGKRRVQDIDKDPVSVYSSVSKPKRKLLSAKMEEP